MVGGLEARIFGAVLVGGMAGQDSGNVEDDGGFFIGERVLGDSLVRKSIVPGMCLCLVFRDKKLFQAAILPCERDLDMILIDRKPEIQQFQLAVVTV